MENRVYCCLLLKILLQTHSYSMIMAERNYRGEQWEMYCLLSVDCFIDIVNLASYDTHCLNKLFICPSNGNQIILSHYCTTTLWPIPCQYALMSWIVSELLLVLPRRLLVFFACQLVGWSVDGITKYKENFLQGSAWEKASISQIWGDRVPDQWFLPLNAMHSTDYAVTRYLSVCLSITRRYCAEMVKISSHCSNTKRYGNIPMGTSLTGASNAVGMKKLQFSNKISLYFGNATR